MQRITIPNILIPIINENNYKIIAEIGVYTGPATTEIISGCKNITGYYAIDPWCEYSGEGGGTLSNVKQKEWDKVYKSMVEYAKDKKQLNIIRDTSINASKQFKDGFFDLVFIDAVHDYKHCKEDILAWKSKVRKGGLLCGHDYHLRFKGVMKAVNELLPQRKISKASIWSIGI